MELHTNLNGRHHVCIQSLDTGWVFPMLAKCFQQAPESHFWQTGKQHSEFGSNLHLHFMPLAWIKINPNTSQVSFPCVVSSASAETMAEGIWGSPKARSFLDVFNGNIFQEERRPHNLSVNVRVGD